MGILRINMNTEVVVFLGGILPHKYECLEEDLLTGLNIIFGILWRNSHADPLFRTYREFCNKSIRIERERTLSHSETFYINFS